MDESGFEAETIRPYGYAPIGKPCIDSYNWQAKKRTNVIGALYEKMLFALDYFEHNINSSIFYDWCKQTLIPSLKTKCVIVMDMSEDKDAPVLVLSHSLFFDHKMFTHQIEHLSKTIRVVSYDDRDQGQSARSELKSVDMDTHTNDAISLIEELDLGPCFFAGNSMGGFISLRLAARRPDLLKGCIVLGSSGELEYKLADFSPLVEGLGAQGTEPFIDTLMYIMFGDDYLADASRASEREYWRDHMLKLGPDIARSANGVIHRTGILDELKGCKVPTLVLAGEQDHAYEVPLLENITKTVVDGQMFVIPKAGHSVALEQPEIVNKYISDFISAHS